MVKLRGPCFSIAASGSVANALTYSDWRRRPYAKAYARPTNPRTPAQTGQRILMGFLQNRWSAMTEAQRISWGTLPNPSNLTRYHLYVQFNLDRWRNFAIPTAVNPPAGVLSYGTYSHFSWPVTYTGYSRLRFKLSALDYAWGLILFHSQTSGFTPAPENAVNGQVVDSTAFTYWTHAPLPAGTHYYRFTRFSQDSKYLLSGTQYAVTVL